jgi:beta-mannosidase
MTYWWDFCPRMVHIGLWDSVGIHFSGPARLENIFVRPRLADDDARADVLVQTQLNTSEAVTARVEVTIRRQGKVIAAATVEQALAAGRSTLDLVLPVSQPELWYPNSYGAQPLYEAEVSVRVGEAGSDSRVVRFGIRRVDLTPNDTDDPAARPYTLRVNGQRVYMKGWNWVPMDVMYGVERPEKLRRLLTLAQRAHVNLLRVWGGGLIEKTAFYDLCDELGILVWQEFIQSSSGIDNAPAEDDAFVAMMRAEAEAIIPLRRNHASLAFWCGGNELIGDDGVPLDESHPVLGMLRDVVSRLDPDRLWLPSSPSGRTSNNTLSAIERDPASLHDVHGPWEFQGVTAQYTLYNAGTSLLHSEFGAEGLTNLKTLNATIAPEHQKPVSLANPVWHHLAAWWVKTDMWQQTWGALDDVPMLVMATQYAQAEGLRYALEADRRRKYHNSGTLPWQFNEPYPMAACTSAVDYYARPKPLYDAVAHAYEPVHVSAQFPTGAWAGHEIFEAEVWVNNSLTTSLDGARLHVRIVTGSGREISAEQATIDVPADSAVSLVSVKTPLTSIDSDVFFLDLVLEAASGESLSLNRYAFTNSADWKPLLALPQSTLEVTVSGDALDIRNVGAAAVPMVWIEDGRDLRAPGGVYFSVSAFALLPGESRRITVEWYGVPGGERLISVRGWNTDEWKG